MADQEALPADTQLNVLKEALSEGAGKGVLLGEAVRVTARFLEQANVTDVALLEAERLLSFITGLEGAALHMDEERRLVPREIERLLVLVGRRVASEPVAYITGSQGFWTHEFKVTPDTLIPRADSETLIVEALDFLPADRPVSLLDLGTGSGCLLLTLLDERRQALGVGLDISEGALAVARENAVVLGVEARAEFRHSDWFDHVRLSEKFDLILSNPPYISSEDVSGLMPDVKNFEPYQALTCGADGYGAFRHICALAGGYLKRGGCLLLEIGAGQAAGVKAIMAGAGFCDIRFRSDLGGHIRAVSGRMSQEKTI